MKSSSDDVAANMLHTMAKNSAPDLVHIYVHFKHNRYHNANTIDSVWIKHSNRTVRYTVNN